MSTRVDPKILRDPPAVPYPPPVVTGCFGTLPDANNLFLCGAVALSDVLPAAVVSSSESEMFRVHVIACKNTYGFPLAVAVRIFGNFSRYTSVATGTYYYYVYLAWGTTASDPPTQPASWTETRVYSGSFNAAASSTWYHDLSTDATVSATVPPNHWLWLRVRGTTYSNPAGTANNTSIGFLRRNVALTVLGTWR